MRAGRDHRTLVLASGNSGKLRELQGLLRPLGFDLRPQSDWETPEADEHAPTFIENALLKARNAARHCQQWAMADDSGLVVPALGGAPGIRSARYSPEGDDASNNACLLKAMEDMEGPERRAYFYCAMVLVRREEDPVPLVSTAAWWGRILHAPRGTGGFGYDPLFEVPEQGCSAAQLPPDTKNRISHRAQSTHNLLAVLRDAPGHVE